MKKLFYLISTLALFTIFALQCKKDDLDNETVSATDNALCEGEYSRIMPEVNSIAIGDPGVNGKRLINQKISAGCPTDSINPADTLDGFPVTLYIMYGNGCVGNDGKTRSGTLRCVFDSAWDNFYSTVHIYLENYYVDGVKFEGNIDVTKDLINRTYTQVVNNGKCSKSGTDAWEIQWSSTRTVTWVSGYLTPLVNSDDVYEIAGAANGINREGKKFAVNITTPLEKKNSCSYITKGVIEIVPEDKKARVLDYGDGACDNKAKLSIGKNSITITLK